MKKEKDTKMETMLEENEDWLKRRKEKVKIMEGARVEHASPPPPAHPSVTIGLDRTTSKTGNVQV